MLDLGLELGPRDPVNALLGKDELLEHRRSVGLGDVSRMLLLGAAAIPVADPALRRAILLSPAGSQVKPLDPVTTLEILPPSG